MVENEANWSQRVMKEELSAGINEWQASEDGDDAKWVLPGGRPGKPHPETTRMKYLASACSTRPSTVRSEVSTLTTATSVSTLHQQIEKLQTKIAEERLKRARLRASLGINREQ